MGFFGDNLGVRGDVRYFRNLGDPEADNEFDIDFGELQLLAGHGGHRPEVLATAGQSARDVATAHGVLLRRRIPGPALATSGGSGTQAVVRPPTVAWTMASPRAVVAPAVRPQRVWKSQVRGKRSESARDRDRAAHHREQRRAAAARPPARVSDDALRTGDSRAW